MTRLIRAELLKLRTIRLPWLLLGAAALTTALFAFFSDFQAGKGGSGSPPLSSAAGLTHAIAFPFFGLLLALVFGTIVASAEFRHNTASATFLATPRRRRVLVAKLVAAAAVGLLFGAVAAGVATGIGLAFVSAKGFAVSLSVATMARYIGGAALGGALLAAVGVGLGSLVRHQVAVIVGVLIWPLAVERLADALFPSAAPYLPWTAATSLATSGTGSGFSPLPFGAAAALVAGVAVAIALVASRTTVLRDVS